MDKKPYRKTVKEKRDQLDKKVKKEYDEKLKNDFLALPEVQKAETIFAYLNFGSEISTMPLIKELLKKGKRVFIPWINQDKKIMELTELKNPEKELQPGYYGILEMKEEYLDLYRDNIDVVLTPGLVFDNQYYRIGYGGGFYDKYFSGINYTPFKVALAYSFQVVEELPREEFDQQIDAILTEKGLSRRESCDKISK